MNALKTGGLPEADKSTAEALSLARLNDIATGQRMALVIWANLSKVMEQQAQNNIAR